MRFVPFARKKERGSTDSYSSGDLDDGFLSISYSASGSSGFENETSTDSMEDDTTTYTNTPLNGPSPAYTNTSFLTSPSTSYRLPRFRSSQRENMNASAQAAADALGKDLEAMGYNLDCNSFLTNGRSGSSSVSERYEYMSKYGASSSLASEYGSGEDPITAMRSDSTISDGMSCTLSAPSHVRRSQAGNASEVALKGLLRRSTKQNTSEAEHGSNSMRSIETNSRHGRTYNTHPMQRREFPMIFKAVEEEDTDEGKLSRSGETIANEKVQDTVSGPSPLLVDTESIAALSLDENVDIGVCDPDSAKNGSQLKSPWSTEKEQSGLHVKTFASRDKISEASEENKGVTRITETDINGRKGGEKSPQNALAFTAQDLIKGPELKIRPVSPRKTSPTNSDIVFLKTSTRNKETEVKTHGQHNTLPENDQSSRHLVTDVIISDTSVEKGPDVSVMTPNEYTTDKTPEIDKTETISQSNRDEHSGSHMTNTVKATEAANKHRYLTRAKLTRAKLLQLSFEKQRARKHESSTVAPTATPAFVRISRSAVSEPNKVSSEKNVDLRLEAKEDQEVHALPDMPAENEDNSSSLSLSKGPDSCAPTPKARGAGPKLLKMLSMSPQKKKREQVILVDETKKIDRSKKKRWGKKTTPCEVNSSPQQMDEGELREVCDLPSSDATLTTSASTVQNTAHTPNTTVLLTPINGGVAVEAKMPLPSEPIQKLIIAPLDASVSSSAKSVDPEPPSDPSSKKPPPPMHTRKPPANPVSKKKGKTKRSTVRFSFLNKRLMSKQLSKAQKSNQIDNDITLNHPSSEMGKSFDSLNASLLSGVAHEEGNTEGVEVVVFAKPDPFSPLTAFGFLDKIEEVDSCIEAGSSVEVTPKVDVVTPRADTNVPTFMAVEEQKLQDEKEEPCFEMILGNTEAFHHSTVETDMRKALKQTEEFIVPVSGGRGTPSESSASVWGFFSVNTCPDANEATKSKQSTMLCFEDNRKTPNSSTHVETESEEKEQTVSIEAIPARVLADDSGSNIKQAVEDLKEGSQTAKESETECVVLKQEGERTAADRTRSLLSEFTDRTRSLQSVGNTISTAGYTQHSEGTQPSNASTEKSLEESGKTSKATSLVEAVESKSNSLFDVLDCFCFGSKSLVKDGASDMSNAMDTSVAKGSNTEVKTETPVVDEKSSISKSNSERKSAGTESSGVCWSKGLKFSDEDNSPAASTLQMEKIQRRTPTGKLEPVAMSLLAADSKGPSTEDIQETNHHLNQKPPLPARSRHRKSEIDEDIHQNTISHVDRVPSHLILNNDNCDDGSCLTSIHSTAAGSKRKKADGTDSSTINTFDIAEAVAWDEIAEATLVIDRAINKIDITRCGSTLEEIRSRDSTVGVDIEKALLTLKRHSDRLGVKESDLLLAMKSQDETASLTPRRTSSARNFVRATSSFLNASGVLRDGETTIDETVNSMTIGEEILDVFKVYLDTRK